MISFISIMKNAQCPTVNIRRPALRVRRSASAFTLIETALALFAISLGLLGIFGLARHGLKNSGDAENETRCALLADTVLESLKARNSQLLAEGRPLDAWQNFWRLFAQNTSSYASYFCDLPQLSDVTSQDTVLKVICGTHALQDSLSAKEPDKWNPHYSLAFIPDSQTQFTIEFSVHPGANQSGADWHVYYATLSYEGGQP